MATFQHKTIRRFRIANFEFKNFLLVIKDEDEANRFRDLVSTLPRRDAIGIVELDEAALAALEKPVGPRVVKGAQNTGNVKAPSKEPAFEQGFVDPDKNTDKKPTDEEPTDGEPGKNEGKKDDESDDSKAKPKSNPFAGGAKK